MSASQIPPYPNPSEEWSEDAGGKRDWGLLLTRLTLILAVSGLIALVVFVLAVVASAGQIMLLFERLR